jgi:Sulfatase-modifying factor enzyme 1
MQDRCCVPDSGRSPQAEADPRKAPHGVRADASLLAGDFVKLDGGAFMMGTDANYGYAQDGEAPAHEVVVSPYSISRHAVTNAQFAAFVEGTGHRTEAEVFGWSFVFAGFLPENFPATQGVAQAPWWRRVEGADWSHPRAQIRRSNSVSTTHRSTSRGTMLSPSALGPGHACPARPSGSLPRGAAWRGTDSPGEMSCTPTESTA